MGPDLEPTNWGGRLQRMKLLGLRPEALTRAGEQPAQKIQPVATTKTSTRAPGGQNIGLRPQRALGAPEGREPPIKHGGSGTYD